MSKLKTEVSQLKDNVFHHAAIIIDTLGPRLAGTKQSLDAADYLKSLSKSFCTDVKTEDFSIHKNAFLGWIRLLVTCYILGVISLWSHLPLIALILTSFSIIILVLQFFLYLPILDFLFPKRKARNVYGTIKPTSTIKQRVIVSGHHDSARIFNFLYRQPALYSLRVTGSIALVFLLIIASVTPLFPTPSLLAFILKIVVSIGLLLVSQMWFFASKKGTPGAGDNLVASLLAIEVGRYFSKHPLTHTELIFASFDAEEEGLRGARNFVKTHASSLTEIKTFVLNADCLYHEKDFFFLTSDLNNFVPLDENLAKDLVNVSLSLGIPNQTKPLAFLTGGTDAAEFGKKNISATTLIGMPWSNDSRSNVYHTPHDTLDAVSGIAIENALEIFITFIEKKDNEKEPK